MATYDDPLLVDVQVYPEKDCSFAGFHWWAFTLDKYSKMYASKFGVDEHKVMERLSGESYFDPATRKWTPRTRVPPRAGEGASFPQAGHQDLYERQEEKLWPMLRNLNVTMKLLAIFEPCFPFRK